MYPNVTPRKRNIPKQTSGTPTHNVHVTHLTNAANETIKVYCRITPESGHVENTTFKIISNRSIQLITPESSVFYRPGVSKLNTYSFSDIFHDKEEQNEIFNCVALPFIQNLVIGKNSAVFAYGVTGSGKTYTMTGTERKPGILPRCLDALFNSISEYQAERFIFKPDKMNGFEIQSSDEALKDEHRLKCVIQKNKSNENVSETRIKNDTKVAIMYPDNVYSVFITYIEIYNNVVCDLLENINEESNVNHKLQARLVREDPSHNMYVHGATEIEVKTSDEAYEIFKLGQKRKRIACTALNNESSRGHSVFTIRLVQAPLDITGTQLFTDKKFITISQLSLVDLAGCERQARTNNVGKLVKEAGNINSSLMILRNCFDILRENQKNGMSKMIPHRESRLTHLFRNFLNGEGDIRMIVCVNPRIEDYDETMQVLKFAEVTQEINTKSTPMKSAGVNYISKQRKLEMCTEKEEISTPTKAVNNVFNTHEMLESFPEIENNNNVIDMEIIRKMIPFIVHRNKQKNEVKENWNEKIVQFRNNLSNHINETIELQTMKRDFEEFKEKTIQNENELLNELNYQKLLYKEKLKVKDKEIEKLLFQLEEKNEIIKKLENTNHSLYRKFMKITDTVDKLIEKENEPKQYRLHEKNNLLKRIENMINAGVCETSSSFHSLNDSKATQESYFQSCMSNEIKISENKDRNSSLYESCFSNASKANDKNNDLFLPNDDFSSTPLITSEIRRKKTSSLSDNPTLSVPTATVAPISVKNRDSSDDSNDTTAQPLNIAFRCSLKVESENSLE